MRRVLASFPSRPSLRSLQKLLTVALALGVPVLAFTPVVGAAGKGSGGAHADGGTRYDPDNVTGISKFMEICVAGNNLYVSKDYPGAIELYKKAIVLAPKNPFGHYLLAEGLLAINNVPEADASLKTAEGFADDRKPDVRAKVLFLTADILDRQKKYAEAKVAWQTYGEYVGKHAGSGVPQAATSRIQSIDDMMKQDKAYEVVRQRIAAEKDAGPAAPAASAPSTSAPLPLPKK